MLSTVLTSLQSLIPGRFVVSAFFPMLAFVISNCAMLAWLNEPARSLLIRTIETSTAKSTFIVLVVLIAAAMLGYIFSALLPGFQLLLEGRWPAWLISFFVPVQGRQLEALENQQRENDRLRSTLENTRPAGWEANRDTPAITLIRPAAADNNAGNFFFLSTRAGRTGQNAPVFPQTEDVKITDGGTEWKNIGMDPELERPVPGWTRRLLQARILDLPAPPKTFTKDDNAAKAVAALEKLRRHNQPITYDSLNSAVDKMVAALAERNANDKKNSFIDLTQSRLERLIEYAADLAASEDIRLTNKLRFNFGLQNPAPTLMGNIANTVQSYAEQRYNLNFEIFWSRMQRAIQKDKDFAPVLQQAKMQLDFLISCCVLTSMWSGVWMATLLLLGTGRLAFLFVALAGPLIAYAWYRAGVAQYRTFADVLRTSIDLFRFDLLNDLHIALPGDVPEEQALWDTLHRIHSFYEPQPLNYQHPKST